MKMILKCLIPPSPVLTGLVCLAVAVPTMAAEWTTSAGVAPAVTYTDNVCLSESNKKGEWVGTITPDGSIQGNGRRANVGISGSVEVNTLSNGDLEDRGCGGDTRYDNREQFAPRGNATADAILVQDWFFIDANGSADQNTASPFISGGDDSLDRTGNTNTTYRYSVSPSLKRRFKDAADLLIRYTYDDQYNTTDVVGDSVQHTVKFNLGSGLVFAPVTWSLEGDYSKVDYSDTDRPGEELNEELNNDSELKSAQLNLGYQLNRAWQINGYYGQEWNDFVSSNDDIDGDFWDVGVRWTPTSRTTVEAGTGDRFFGSTPRFSINHRHKRSVLSATYKRDLTYARDIRTLQDSLPDQPPNTGGNSTTLTNSPLLDERFTLAYAFTGQRSRLDISASYSDQTREDGGPNTAFQETTFKSISVSVNRTLSRRLSVSGQASWDESSPKGSSSDIADDTETWRMTLGANRRLSENMSLSLDYEYTDRQSSGSVSDTFSQEYQENRITLSLNIDLL